MWDGTGNPCISYKALVLYTYLYVYNRAPYSRKEFDIHCWKSNLSLEIPRISMLNRWNCIYVFSKYTRCFKPILPHSSKYFGSLPSLSVCPSLPTDSHGSLWPSRFRYWRRLRSPSTCPESASRKTWVDMSKLTLPLGISSFYPRWMATQIPSMRSSCSPSLRP